MTNNASTKPEKDRGEFRLTLNIAKSYEKTNDDGEQKFYIAGLASGTGLDRDGERMAESAVEAFEKAINDGIVVEGEWQQVPLRSGHRREWDDILGHVVKAETDSEHNLWIEAELDETNPVAMGLYTKLNKGAKPGRPLKLGLSVAGTVVKADRVYDPDLKKHIRVFHDVRLREISVVGAPAYPTAFVEVLTKSWNWDEESHEENTMTDVAKTIDTDDEAAMNKAANDVLSGALSKALEAAQNGEADQAEKAKRTVTETYNSTSTRTVETPEGQEDTIYLSAKDKGTEEVTAKGTDPQDKLAEVLSGLTAQMAAINEFMQKSVAAPAAAPQEQSDAAPAAEETAKSEKPASVANAGNADLAKAVQAAVEAAVKPLTDELATAQETIKGLSAKVEELEAQPADRSLAVRKAKGHVSETGEVTVEKFREQAQGKTGNDILKLAVQQAMVAAEE